MKLINVGLWVLMIFGHLNVLSQQEFVFSPGQPDYSPLVREAIQKTNGAGIKLVFKKGTYFFRPDFSFGEYRYITNHENGYKHIAFPLKGFSSVEIVGEDAEFIFHGQMFPFLIDSCSNVKIKGIRIDWDIPFLFQGEVVAVNKEEGWRELKPSTDGFSWKIHNHHLIFPDVDGFTFSSLGSSLPFEKNPKRVAHGAWDFSSNPERVERLPNGNLRFYEKMKYYPPVGTILNSKGPKGENRYAPAFQVISSKDVVFEDVIIHHALGMGFLAERTDNVTIRDCGIYVREGSPRVVSTIADATHFCNCKGKILVEGCRFEQMLDDGTNVHGTYVEVNKVLSPKSLRYELKHFQQTGFVFAGVGDSIWFIHAPSPARAEVRCVTGVKVINERFAELTFSEPLSSGVKEGDILENKTWNPEFTMRGCTIRNHRARNVVLKSPLKTVIENNHFSSMMSSVLFRGETYYWFESGAVEDVLIRNNTFEYCAYSGSEHAVLYITPRLGKQFSKTEAYDNNIRFEDNHIRTFDSRIVIADRAKNLVIRNNVIEKTYDAPPLYPDAPLFELIHCDGVEITNNKYTGEYKAAIVADSSSKKRLVVEKNKGF